MRLAFRPLLAAGIAALLLGACATGSSRNPMSFFITSANPGKGGDLGGLAGADAYCKALASAVGAGDKHWRAYLSTTSQNGGAVVNARDRIGKGPWRNAKGVVIANDVAQLHGQNNISKETALTEKGTPVNGRTDSPNMHDILTGSTPDGRASTAANDTTCSNWTSGGAGSAILGHHDRGGTNPDPVANVSWNSSHGSRGCDMPSLKSTGGDGRFYCFAAN
jgi:hypothetical protein